MPGIKVSPNKAAQSPKKSPKQKGKQVQSPTSSKSPSKQQLQPSEQAEQDDNELLSLANLVAQNAHLLVRGRGDAALENQARQVVKYSFDRGEHSLKAFP